MRSEDTLDGSADFYRASQLNTSSHGLRLCFRKPAGVRASAAAFGPVRFVAVPLGKLGLSTEGLRFSTSYVEGLG